jgi:hypothetical protein
MLAPHGLQLASSVTAVDPKISSDYSFDMALLRGVFWFGLFFVLTFCFVVLFEYGLRDFSNGAEKEYARIKSLVIKRIEKIEGKTAEQTAGKSTSQ